MSIAVRVGQARFTMPGDEEKQMFYSFNVGPIHFVSISTEYYYFVEYGTEQMVNQYHWLEQDLAQVLIPVILPIRCK